MCNLRNNEEKIEKYNASVLSIKKDKDDILKNIDEMIKETIESIKKKHKS